MSEGFYKDTLVKTRDKNGTICYQKFKNFKNGEIIIIFDKFNVEHSGEIVISKVPAIMYDFMLSTNLFKLQNNEEEILFNNKFEIIDNYRPIGTIDRENTEFGKIVFDGVGYAVFDKGEKIESELTIQSLHKYYFRYALYDFDGELILDDLTFNELLKTVNIFSHVDNEYYENNKDNVVIFNEKNFTITGTIFTKWILHNGVVKQFITDGDRLFDKDLYNEKDINLSSNLWKVDSVIVHPFSISTETYAYNIRGNFDSFRIENDISVGTL